MKDLIITSGRLKKEMIIISSCFTTAFLINVAAIIMYKTPWHEMFTQIGYVIVITIVLYLVVAFFRLISVGIIRLVKKSWIHINEYFHAVINGASNSSVCHKASCISSSFNWGYFWGLSRKNNLMPAIQIIIPMVTRKPLIQSLPPTYIRIKDNSF